jgi:hypothetical protein
MRLVAKGQVAVTERKVVNPKAPRKKLCRLRPIKEFFYKATSFRMSTSTDPWQTLG